MLVYLGRPFTYLTKNKINKFITTIQICILKKFIQIHISMVLSRVLLTGALKAIVKDSTNNIFCLGNIRYYF